MRGLNPICATLDPPNRGGDRMTDEITKDMAKLTAKERAHMTYMFDVSRRVEWDLHNAIDRNRFIPDEWHEIAKRTPDRPRTKVTMRIEADVVKFFRSMGRGHLTRMGDVLKTYMHARLAGVIRGADTINHYRVRQDEHAGPRPAFGGMAEMLGEAWSDLPAPEGTGPRTEDIHAELRYRMKLIEEERKGK